jgi:hypothetical protein
MATWAEQAHARPFALRAFSELDVERWTLNVGRLEIPYLISITSMSTRLRQGFGMASEQKQR